MTAGGSVITVVSTKAKTAHDHVDVAFIVKYLKGETQWCLAHLAATHTPFARTSSYQLNSMCCDIREPTVIEIHSC
eukprot:m.330136 g.330136  ORF g.330136 m.330136 type:complete len:76 (+) comp16512_c0_seq18:298-525(+)